MVFPLEDWSTVELRISLKVLAYKIFAVPPFLKPLDTFPVEEPEGNPKPFSFRKVIIPVPLVVEFTSNVLCLELVEVLRSSSTSVTTTNALGPELPVMSVDKAPVYVVKPIFDVVTASVSPHR